MTDKELEDRLERLETSQCVNTWTIVLWGLILSLAVALK